tara:strand:+ start:2542 stop:2697 length:156 start_codon:yes stop_codon:yes gene_type:complete
LNKNKKQSPIRAIALFQIPDQQAQIWVKKNNKFRSGNLLLRHRPRAARARG